LSPQHPLLLLLPLLLLGLPPLLLLENLAELSGKQPHSSAGPGHVLLLLLKVMTSAEVPGQLLLAALTGQARLAGLHHGPDSCQAACPASTQANRQQRK
jgi:hypothetical protein